MSAVFEEAKALVTPEEAAKAYGLRVERHKAVCPFHNDHHPSLSFYGKVFRCFTCGEKGDAVAFVAKLFSIAPYDAAVKILDDFGAGARQTPYEAAAVLRRRHREEEALSWCDRQHRIFSDLQKGMEDVKQALTAQITETDGPPKALCTLWRLEPSFASILDLLTTGSREERLCLYQTRRKEVEDLAAHFRTIFRSAGSGGL